MKSFEDVKGYLYASGASAEDIYNAGATEARKSMRCLSCIYHINGVCEADGFMCGKCTPNNFGCINHAVVRKENG